MNGPTCDCNTGYYYKNDIEFCTRNIIIYNIHVK